MMDIRYPSINGATEAAQLQQLKSYLYQLVDQLNMALKDMGGSSTESYAYTAQKVAAEAYYESTTPSNTFNAIKSLIIKSAEIVQAYYDEIEYKLRGTYMATSDFGTYTSDISSTLIATSESLTQLLESVQSIDSRVTGVENQTLETNAHIKTGILDYEENGRPIVGIEVGQIVEENGVEIFDKYARFTADRMEFYGANKKVPVAWISDRKLYITNVEITGAFMLGKLKDEVQDDGSIVTKWDG